MEKNAKTFQERVATFGKVGTIKWWVGQVENKGEWDYKRSIFTRQRSPEYIYNGQRVSYDAPGNINYGYTGRALGLPLWVLQGGAGLAQILAGRATFQDFRSYFDDPADQVFISLGYNINVKK